MTDRPIIFSAPMVRALLDGRKTQTRRIIKPQPGELDQVLQMDNGSWHVHDSRGGHMSEMTVRYATGDRLWVREAFATDGPVVRYVATDDIHLLRKKRPSIHMPRWASRITLEVTGVNVERLQDISEADAVREGVYCFRKSEEDDSSPRDIFADLWRHLHGPESWDQNPFVAAISFKAHKCNIDKIVPA